MVRGLLGILGSVVLRPTCGDVPITRAVRIGRDPKCEELPIGEMKTEAYGLAGKRGQVGAVIPFDSTLCGVAGERLGSGEHFVVGTERFDLQFPVLRNDVHEEMPAAELQRTRGQYAAFFARIHRGKTVTPQHRVKGG